MVIGMRIAPALSIVALATCAVLGLTVMDMQKRLAQIETGAVDHQHDLSGMAPADHAHDLSGVALEDHGHADLERRIAALESRSDYGARLDSLDAKVAELGEQSGDNDHEGRLQVIEERWKKLTTPGAGLDEDLYLGQSRAIRIGFDTDMELGLTADGAQIFRDKIERTTFSAYGIGFYGEEGLGGINAVMTMNGLTCRQGDIDSAAFLRDGISLFDKGDTAFAQNLSARSQEFIEDGIVRVAVNAGGFGVSDERGLLEGDRAILTKGGLNLDQDGIERATFGSNGVLLFGEGGSGVGGRTLLNAYGLDILANDTSVITLDNLNSKGRLILRSAEDESALVAHWLAEGRPFLSLMGKGETNLVEAYVTEYGRGVVGAFNRDGIGQTIEGSTK